ncbi:hypothetical protein [Janthinobacterium psychrotolerans]|nr:hypothetical protein [Janthinobacterium psychrotolerans]
MHKQKWYKNNIAINIKKISRNAGAGPRCVAAPDHYRHASQDTYR